MPTYYQLTQKTSPVAMSDLDCYRVVDGIVQFNPSLQPQEQKIVTSEQYQKLLKTLTKANTTDQLLAARQDCVDLLSKSQPAPDTWLVATPKQVKAYAKAQKSVLSHLVTVAKQNELEEVKQDLDDLNYCIKDTNQEIADCLDSIKDLRKNIAEYQTELSSYIERKEVTVQEIAQLKETFAKVKAGQVSLDSLIVSAPVKKGKKGKRKGN